MSVHPVRPAPTPWQVAEKPLPPHDLELFAADGAVIARWDGELLDQLGARLRLRQDFDRIAQTVNEYDSLMEHAGPAGDHVKHDYIHVPRADLADLGLLTNALMRSPVRTSAK